MNRSLEPKELNLLMLLLEANESIPEHVVTRLREQAVGATVREIGSPCFLAIQHECDLESSATNVFRLPAELVASDEGVPILIYATIIETTNGEQLDTFVTDRMDGSPISNYPNSADQMMIIEGGRMKGGTDLRNIYIVEGLTP